MQIETHLCLLLLEEYGAHIIYTFLIAAGTTAKQAYDSNECMICGHGCEAFE